MRMKSVLNLHLLAYLVRGYDRRDRKQTFEETIIVSDAGRKSCTFPQNIKDQYEDMGYEVTSVSLPDFAEARGVVLDLQQLYNESTDRKIISKGY